MKYILLIIIVTLTACASIPQDAPRYSPAPKAKAGYGTLYIYRYYAPPYIHSPTITINNQEILDPPEKSYTWIHLKSGVYQVNVDWSIWASWPDLNFPIRITDGEEYFLKITGDSQWGWSATKLISSAKQVPKNLAEKELKSCCKYVKPSVNQL